MLTASGALLGAGAIGFIAGFLAGVAWSLSLVARLATLEGETA
jgi:hypothetical protein